MKIQAFTRITRTGLNRLTLVLAGFFIALITMHSQASAADNKAYDNYSALLDCRDATWDGDDLLARYADAYAAALQHTANVTKIGNDLATRGEQYYLERQRCYAETHTNPKGE